MISKLKHLIGETHPRSSWQVLGIGLVVSWAILKVVPRMVGGEIQGIADVPGWVPVIGVLGPGALIVGLSILLTTARSFDAVHVMTPRHVALFKGLATLIAAAAVVVSLLFGFPSIRGTLPDGVRVVVYSVYVMVLGTAAIACVISLALTLRAAEQPEARALALFLALLALYWGPVLHTSWVGFEPGSVSFGRTVGGNTVLGAISLAALVLSVAAFVRFSSLFPRRLTETDLQSSRFLKSLRAIRVKLLSPAIVWGVGAALAVDILWPGEARGLDGADLGWIDLGPWFAAWLAATGLLYFGLPLMGMTAGALNLRSGYVSSTEPERKKILWVVAGCVIGTCMILAAVAGFILGMSDVPVLGSADILMLLLPFSPLVVVLSLAMAVFYKGAIHPALVIRRATVYSMLGVLLVAMFSAAEGLLSELLEEALGLTNVASAALMGVLITILLIPLRAPLSRWVSRWLPDSAAETERADEPTYA